ncbi:MAG: SDR family NAD(P)-dependent oxidoreductase [Eubacteriaceae bacterium]|nr:SDR family NAD(P)-dependent oxidoreductase [Eubacteriaceae bacterium]
MKIGIVTGASSGLGREFTKQISERLELDEIWAIARRKDKLEELEEISMCSIRPVPLDLLEKSSFDEIETMLKGEEPEVKILVNAAGLGRIGLSRETSRQDNDAMIDLNCRAAVDMTVAVLPYMKKKSRVLNICSSAAFQPLTGINTYAASKSFLLSWTKALHIEQLTSGIHVTAVCPYWIKSTEFIPGAKKTGSNAVKHFPGASKPPSVVRWAMVDSAANMWVSSTSPFALFLRFFSKFIPHCIIAPIWDLMRRI